MIKWLVNIWYRHNPECHCGWKMKYKENPHQMEWKCIWSKKCGWGTFQDTNGKLHWWK
jgi:tRNA(Ile2) C34 agmatinyltransferase TiaS